MVNSENYVSLKELSNLNDAVLILIQKSIEMYNSYGTMHKKQLFLFQHNFELMMLKCCKNNNRSFLHEVV